MPSSPLHHLQMSESNEWYTPPEVIEIARLTMGHIDLDPASNPIAQQWIQATRCLTQSDDGLSLPWYGNIWLNMPYGWHPGTRKSSVDIWARNLNLQIFSGSVEQACVLVGGRHLNLPGVQALMDGHDSRLQTAVLFFGERIKFLRIPEDKIGNATADDLEVVNAPTGNNVMIYAGGNVRNFCKHAEDYGTVMVGRYNSW